MIKNNKLRRSCCQVQGELNLPTEADLAGKSFKISACEVLLDKTCVDNKPKIMPMSVFIVIDKLYNKQSINLTNPPSHYLESESKRVYN